MNGFISYNSIKLALSQYRREAIIAGLDDPFKKKGSFNKANKSLYNKLKKLDPKDQKKFKGLEKKKKQDRVAAGFSFIGEYFSREEKGKVGSAYNTALDTIENSDRNYWNLQMILNDIIYETASIDNNFVHTQKITVIHTEELPPEIADECFDFNDYTIADLAAVINNEISDDQSEGSREYHDTVTALNALVRGDDGNKFYNGSGDLMYSLEPTDNEIVLVLRWTSIDFRSIVITEKPEQAIEPEEEIEAPAPEKDKEEKQIEKEILKQKLRKIEAETDDEIRKINRAALVEEKNQLESEIERLENKVDRYEKRKNTSMVTKYENRIEEYEERINDIMKKLKT